MSAFDQDITDEEQATGFTTGEQGDETFLLSTLDEYPGVMPELDYMEAAVIPPEDGTPSLLDNELDSDELDYSTDEIEEVNDSHDLESESDSELTDFDEIPEYEDDSELDSPQPVEEPVLQDNSISDAALKELVESELERSKKLKESKPAPATTPYGFGPDDIELVSDPFEEVGDNASEIQISDIDLDKPSRIDVKKIQEEEPVVPPPIVNLEEENKKKKRTPFFSTKRVLAFSGLIAILFLALIILFYDDIVTKNKYNITSSESEQNSNTIDQSSYSGKSDTESKKPKKDSVKIRKAVNLALLKEGAESSGSDSLNVEIYLPDELDGVIDSISTPKDSLSDSKSLDNYYVDSKARPSKSIANNSLNNTTKPSKRRINNSNKKINNSNKIKSVENKAVPNLKKGPSTDGTFAVQIISTPSYDDASDWLKKLEARGISNGIISERFIRDKTWYRVRFGNFQTYQEASDALNRAGFDGSWVDRIK